MKPKNQERPKAVYDPAQEAWTHKSGFWARVHINPKEELAPTEETNPPMGGNEKRRRKTS